MNKKTEIWLYVIALITSVTIGQLSAHEHDAQQIISILTMIILSFVIHNFVKKTKEYEEERQNFEDKYK